MEDKNLLHQHRKEYQKNSLDIDQLNKDPYFQFCLWFEDALITEDSEPNAVALATADVTGRPSLRMVLMKEHSALGFTFFTNYLSRKGRELSENPYAALLFWWQFTERQVRIEGKVSKVSQQKSDFYFQSRPIESQIAASVSEQSSPIDSKNILKANFEQMFSNHPKHLKRPTHWGGYLLVPDRFEFWQGGRHRLHDRFEYSKSNETWTIRRLQP